MGFFGFGKTSTTLRTKDSATQELVLRTKTFEKSLMKKIIPCKVARVVLVLDMSGSMEPLYNNGTVQTVVDRILPLANKFDDNQSMEVYLFANRCTEIDAATPNNFFDYVNKVAIPNISWGGTSYAPVMKKIVDRYGINDTSTDPTFVIFITDGDNDDHSETTKIVKDAAKYNIFWKFIGIGDALFNFLKKLDTLSGRVVDNANFQEVNDINTISDDVLYDRILEEYGDWQMAAKKANILS